MDVWTTRRLCPCLQAMVTSADSWKTLKILIVILPQACNGLSMRSAKFKRRQGAENQSGNLDGLFSLCGHLKAGVDPKWSMEN